MQSDRKKIGILIMIVALIIIIAIIYFVFLRKPAATVPGGNQPESNSAVSLPQSGQAGTTTPGDKKPDAVYNIAAETPRKINGDDLGQISMSFAERFGSFSNQSNYGNFTDLSIMMTDSMKNWAEKNVENLRAKATSSAYYGIKTTALTYEVKSFDNNAGTAEITVTTQRQESGENAGGAASYIQGIDLSLAKVNGEWLFDKAYWQTK